VLQGVAVCCGVLQCEADSTVNQNKRDKQTEENMREKATSTANRKEEPEREGEGTQRR